MRVLGLDTGLRNSGWAIVDIDDAGHQRVVACDALRLEEGTSMERATALAALYDLLLKDNDCSAIVYESPSIPPNAGSAWKIGLAFGVVAGLRFPASRKVSVSPIAIKKALIPRWKPASGERSRSTKAKAEGKKRLIAAVERRFGRAVLSHVRKGLREHPADAIAAVAAAVALGRLAPHLGLAAKRRRPADARAGWGGVPDGGVPAARGP